MKNKKIIDLENFVTLYFTKKNHLKVLDAGCGSVNNISLSKSFHITGIDISEKQLERSKHLNEKIRGDIQEYSLKDRYYDMIICWDVLEHLKKPHKAIDNFISAIKDGIIIVKIPNIFSLKGIITKYTPFFIHKFIYKYIFKSSRVKKKEFGPFKTYLKFSISENALRKYANNNKLEVIFFSKYDFGDIWNPLKGTLKAKVYFYLKEFLRIVTLGKINDSEMIIVFKKK